MSNRKNLDNVIKTIRELLTNVDVLLVQDWYWHGKGFLRCNV